MLKPHSRGSFLSDNFPGSRFARSGGHQRGRGGGAGRGFVEVSNFHCSSRTGRTQPNSGPVVLITIRLRRGHRGPNFRQVCRERRRVLSRLGSTSPCSHTRVKFRSRCTVKPARPNSPASCPRPCLSLLKPPFSPLTILLTYHAVL